jgi:hypothetical protein
MIATYAFSAITQAASRYAVLDKKDNSPLRRHELFDAKIRLSQNRSSSILINQFSRKGTGMPRTAIKNLNNT